MVNGTLISSVVLVIVGLFKLPFAQLKEKLKKWYTRVLAIFSFACTIAATVLFQLFVFNASVISWEFVILLSTTIGIVKLAYEAYEITALKEGIHSLFAKFSAIIAKNKESKLAKIITKAGLDKVQTVVDILIETQKAKETPDTSTEIKQ